MVTELKDTELSTRVLKTELIQWKKLQFVQQENFKEWIDTGDKKLVQSLLNYNFIDPFKVWQDGDVLWCLDGFHRYTDLLKLIELGCKVPDKLHATFIKCESKKEAAELVLVYSSIYAKITQDGLSQFLEINDIDYSSIINSIEIPEFDTILPNNTSDEIVKMREIEAIKLRDRIYELTRHISAIKRIIPLGYDKKDTVEKTPTISAIKPSANPAKQTQKRKSRTKSAD